MAPDGIVAVLRGDDPGRVERAARAVARAGVRFIEITCTVPGALGVIERLADLRNAVLGMGTVLSVAQAEAALNAGARFLVSPACLPELVPTARAQGAACVLGGLSPTEVFRAWEAGADLVKVFPIGPVGGPAYLRELAGPYPHTRLMASGGVGLEDIPAYRLPTVAAIALGGELAPIAAMAAGDWAEITRRAQQAVASWQART
jgi:2-dehydro-3-deoxyphosphogluconate aldolase/(4S)-4-hydroxy-2-oxoglutarate aldolase